MTPARAPRPTVHWAIAMAVASCGPVLGQQELQIRVIDGDEQSKLVVTVPAEYPGGYSEQRFTPPVWNVKFTGKVPAGTDPPTVPDAPPVPVTKVWLRVPKGTGVVREIVVCTFAPLPEPTSEQRRASERSALLLATVFFQLVVPVFLVVPGIVLTKRAGEVLGTRVIGVGSLVSGLATLGLVLACQFLRATDALGPETRDRLIALGLVFMVAVDLIQFGLIRTAVETVGAVLGRGDQLTREEIRAIVEYLAEVFPSAPAARRVALSNFRLEGVASRIDMTGSATDFARHVVDAARRAKSAGPADSCPPMALLVEYLRGHPRLQNPNMSRFFTAVLDKYNLPKTAGGNAMAWCDDLPLDFTRPETREAENLLVAGYPTNVDALTLATNAGLDPAQLNQMAKVKHLVREILTQARKSNRLADLFVEVLADDSQDETRSRLSPLLAGFEARLAAAALRRKPSLATLALLPPSAELRVPGAPPQPLDARGLEKLVNAAAGFADVVVFRQRLAEAEVRTARIDVGGKATGTGFLVGDSLLLTNWHVVKAVVGDGAVARFDHKFAPGAAAADQGRAVKFASDWKVAHSPHEPPLVEVGADGPPVGTWDFALVRLAEPVGAQGIGPNPAAANADLRGHYYLDGAAYTFDPKEPLLVVGHPAGRPMQLSYASPSEVRTTKHLNRLRYQTNTEGGSSGSPVFNKDWRVVALHHAGGPTAVPGELDLPGGDFNQGVPVEAVVASLRERLKGSPVLRELGLE